MARNLLDFGLKCGFAAFFVYFGIQILSSFFYPDYSFMTMVASDFGTDRFSYATLFNGGLFVFGILLAFASLALLIRMPELKISKIWTVLAFVCVLAIAISTLYASQFPMGDSRHGGPQFLQVGAFASIPLLFGFWKATTSSGQKLALAAAPLVIIALVPFVSGMAKVDTHLYQGAIQRLLAVATFGPVSLCSKIALGSPTGPKHPST